MYQINGLYTFNLYNGISQLHLNKAGTKKREIEDCQHLKVSQWIFFLIMRIQKSMKHLHSV